MEPPGGGADRFMAKGRKRLALRRGTHRGKRSRDAPLNPAGHKREARFRAILARKIGEGERERDVVGLSVCMKMNSPLIIKCSKFVRDALQRRHLNEVT